MALRSDALALAVAYLLAGGQTANSQAGSSGPIPPVLTHINEIRRLTPDQARRRFPIHLRAVVTYFDPLNMFVQDPTGGIWVATTGSGLTAQPGQLVDLQGVTTHADFAPDI